MSGQRPPEWEDPDDGHSDAGLPDEWRPDAGLEDPDLAAVTSLLAAVPGPALPASFEARISAAIAAEATARAAGVRPDGTQTAGLGMGTGGTDDAKTTARSTHSEEFSPTAADSGASTAAKRGPRRTSRASGSAAAASKPRDSRPGGRRRRLRMPSAQASGWLVVCCLVIAGFGYLFAHASGSSSSSAPENGTVAQGAAAPAASASASSGHELPYDATVPEPASLAPAASGPNMSFLVTESGTRYQRSTLASQVRDQLYALGVETPGAVTPAASASAVPSAASSAAGTAAAPASSSFTGGYVPSTKLAGCVSQLTGGVTPSLVDRASYDGTPAYIIAVPTQVWVVGLGCTAADPRLITRVSLAG
jgi:hypothetical protein